MKRLLSAFIAILFPFAATAKLNVVTTTPDLAAIAAAVGGDRVEVKSIARGSEDPHYLEPKPSYIVLASRADLLVEVGLGLEVAWLPVLMTQSRNAGIQPGSAGHLDASRGVAVEDVPTGAISRAEGDVHPEGNPHYWLNPKNGAAIAKEIVDRLTALDPADAAYYRGKLAAFTSELDGKIAGWERDAQPLKGKQAVSYHKNYSYLAHWLGIDIVGYIEPKPGIPPTPAHTLGLIDMMSAKRVPYILSASYYDARAAREIARKTGARLLVLPSSVGAEPAITTYFDLFDTIIQKLKEPA